MDLEILMNEKSKFQTWRLPVFVHAAASIYVGAEFAGPENGGTKKCKDWKEQDLENDGPNRRSCIFQVLHFQSPRVYVNSNNCFQIQLEFVP